MSNKSFAKITEHLEAQYGPMQSPGFSFGDGIQTARFTGSKDGRAVISNVIATWVVEESKPLALDAVIMTVEVYPYTAQADGRKIREKKTIVERKQFTV